jgi:ADP-ribose pyrophosphatase
MADARPSKLPHENYPQLEEVRLSGQEVYAGSLLRVQRDLVRAPDGHEQTFEYTLHPGAAAIIPMLDDGQIVMERQWRYAMNRSFLEFPAGKLNRGEDPLLAAQRELAEETGYRAAQWGRLGEMHPVIAYSTETIHLFIARGLTLGESARELGECLEVVTLHPQELFEMIYRGEVTDSKTLACAVWLNRLIREEWSPQWI